MEEYSTEIPKLDTSKNSIGFIEASLRKVSSAR